MDIRDSVRVKVPGELHGYNLMGLSKLVCEEDSLRLYMTNLSLVQDETVKSSLELYTGYYYVGSHTLNIQGDLRCDNANLVYVNNGTLEIEGDAYCNVTNALNISEGVLEVGGDLTMARGDLSLYSAIRAAIQGDLKR